MPVAAAAWLASCGGGGGDAKPAGTAPSASPPPPATVVRRCDARHPGVGYGGMTGIAERQSLRVGPAMFGGLRALQLSQLPDRPSSQARYVAIESIVFVTAGHSVTVAVPPPERRFVGLIYDQGKFRDDGAYRIDDLDQEARFVACKDPHFNRGLSQYDGGVVVAGRRCFTLDFYIQGSPRKIERRIPIKGGCPTG
ncbi:MAG: hypothetical protein QOF37_1754 [Thermoleophilaceae bacterium]|nr:hypothetical protein [Thermoleophilaceae bacterium]